MIMAKCVFPNCNCYFRWIVITKIVCEKIILFSQYFIKNHLLASHLLKLPMFSFLKAGVIIFSAINDLHLVVPI